MLTGEGRVLRVPGSMSKTPIKSVLKARMLGIVRTKKCGRNKCFEATDPDLPAGRDNGEKFLLAHNI